MCVCVCVPGDCTLNKKVSCVECEISQVLVRYLIDTQTLRCSCVYFLELLAEKINLLTEANNAQSSLLIRRLLV